MNKNNIKQDAQYGIDSRYNSKQEQEADGIVLMEARLKRLKKLSENDIIKAKLMQLNYKMEAYVKQPIYDDQNYFLDFLKTYIDTIYSKRSFFAVDIGITPIKLSQVVNSHREPKDEFIMKLMIHSEKVYQNVCEFHKKTWYQVYFHEKICDTMSSQETWRPVIEKQVQLKQSIYNKVVANS